jgi:hypothetical protein
VCYHYQPASMVSGDYCDLFEIDDGLLFMLGDVSGKGVAASMVMSHLHATFRTLAGACLPLDRMVQDANRIFCESTLAGQFATIVVGQALATVRWSLSALGICPCFTSIATAQLQRIPREYLWGCSVTRTSQFIN